MCSKVEELKKYILQLSLDDGLPASICESCHSQVNRFNEFRLLIESSDRALRSYLDDSQEKQKICEQSEGVRDLDCQTFLMESEVAEDSRELFGVNTILVPSPNGTEVSSRPFKLNLLPYGITD